MGHIVNTNKTLNINIYIKIYLKLLTRLKIIYLKLQQTVCDCAA